MRSTKAGASTPATLAANSEYEQYRTSLNEGRGLDPGNTRRRGRGPGGGGALNEGRGLDPGNTGLPPPPLNVDTSAQRRPGPRPRQHRPLSLAFALPLCAQRRPGPRPRQHLALPVPLAAWADAQRRPGPRPRQHVVSSSVITMGLTAQRRPGPRPRQHGSIVPRFAAVDRAQRRPGPRPRQHWCSWWCSCRSPRTLNEGRGLDPGNT